ncbi:MAG: TetR family transcriptional regulator [Flammeovirgaceae bacterium]|nr:TetR family transcriptional regulator [Flammeovirgaceae bacterium]HCX20602.1 TetR/AcrR family transcriptional regulator [Cytophagales bacterium]
MNNPLSTSKRAQILLTCTRLFRKSGYAGTSMQDIANELGIKPASLYNHISSKQDILVELLSFGANLFVDGMKDIKQSQLNDLQKLERLIALHLRITVGHTDLMALIAVEWRHLEGEGLREYLKLRNSYENDFRVILKGAMENGLIHSMDIEIAFFSILTTLKWFYSWYDKHSQLSMADIEEYLKQLLLGGLKI